MRAIVSNPDVISGLWRLDGTRIGVAHIRRLLEYHSIPEINAQYPDLRLTPEEADACLAWEFPPIHDGPELGRDVTVRCVCGEWMDTLDSVDWSDIGLICPDCGRRYRVTVVEDTEQAAVEQRREEPGMNESGLVDLLGGLFDSDTETVEVPKDAIEDVLRCAETGQYGLRFANAIGSIRWYLTGELTTVRTPQQHTEASAPQAGGE